MLLLLFASSSVTDYINIVASDATVTIEATARTPNANRPRQEFIWTYGLDAVQTGVLT